MSYEISEIVILEEEYLNVTTNEDDKDETNKKVYLDCNATTPLEKEVVASISSCLTNNWQNPSGKYEKAQECKKLIEESRKSLSEMINSKHSDIIFVSGGTEANNLVFNSVIKEYDIRKKAAAQFENDQAINHLPHIIISNIEHDSVKLIADYYKKENISEITEVEVNEHGFVNKEDVINAIKPNTVLISIMLANNETGVIQPIEEIGNELNKLELKTTDSSRICPLFFHTDAAQAIGKIKVDVENLQVDFLTIVGHKFYGPRIGALFARSCFDINNDKKAPVHHSFLGAGQERGLRPGTENTPMIVGLKKAAELVTNNLEKYSTHMEEIRNYLEDCLSKEFGTDVKFNGRTSESKRLCNTSNCSFIGSENFKGYLILENCFILEASTGASCHSDNQLKVSQILLNMKIDKSVASNAIRFSVGRETTKKEIDMVLSDLKQSLKKLSTI